jgi:hypothetical protein
MAIAAYWDEEDGMIKPIWCKPGGPPIVIRLRFYVPACSPYAKLYLEVSVGTPGVVRARVPI